MASTAPKPFVFVLMPFDSAFNDVYELGIKAACKEAGAYCERVDEQTFQGSMLERIYNQIAKADIIVADMSGKNPNVFYETGYAHALGKKTVLLTKTADDIPFDLKHYAHLVYHGDITNLKKALKKRVKYFIDHPDKSKSSPFPSLVFNVQGVDIARHPVVYLHAPKVGDRFFQDFSFDIHNPTETPVDIWHYQLGFVYPTRLGKPALEDDPVISFPNDKYMRIFRCMANIHPLGWHQERAKFNISVEPANLATWCKLCIYSPNGMKEIEFTLHLILDEE